VSDRGEKDGAGRGGERLQKLLANAGEGSRRGLEQRIADGAVRVNGTVATLGDTAVTGDEVAIDDRVYRVVDKAAFHRSIVYNKPLGEITTRNDPQGRPTVFDRLPRVKGGRWVAVGRLDINTTGLLLLTTDGELANAMMHPSSQVDREYACRVFGEVDEDMIRRLKQGVELDDGPAKFGDIVDSGGDGENRWFHVTLMEGRNREVRRLWASQGVTVSRLKRVRYGAVFLPHRLRMGEWSELSPEDHKILREDVGLPGEPRGQLSLRPVKGSPPKKRRKTPTRKKPASEARRRATGRGKSQPGGKPRKSGPRR
jgi:23S rRNA pseudouridine2605 synthase